VPHQDVLEIMRGAKAVIIPSLWDEGYPLVAAEAFACGTPVIATRTGGLSTVVQEGVNGFLFDEKNAGGLRAALEAVSSTFLQASTRSFYERTNSPAAHAEMLMRIYHELSGC
jgi:glycosyltransferase involved in cell wall biosynthesis